MGSVWMATDRHTGQKMAVKEAGLGLVAAGLSLEAQPLKQPTKTPF